MESNSYSGKIHCSAASAELLVKQAPGIPLTKRGKINVKGKGEMVTWWVSSGGATNGAGSSKVRAAS